MSSLPFASSEIRPTLSRQIALELRKAILRGEFTPGSKLSIEDLRSRFSVSLSPLREALSSLATTGFLSSEDQRGFRVASLSIANLMELTKLRLVLEPMALVEAMANGNNEWRSAIAKAHAELRGCARNPNDPDSVECWEAVHRQFHMAMLSATESPLLLSIIEVLLDQTDRYRRIVLSEIPARRDAASEHARIEKAVLAGEVEIATALLRQHITNTGNSIAQVLESFEAD